MNREQIKEFMGANGSEWITDLVEVIVREAVEAEREACAVLIEPKNDKSDWTEYAHQCAILARFIRFRGEKPL